MIWYAPLNQLTPVGEAGEIGSVFRLEQNFPNPFNPVTAISYSLQTEADVQLTVYNTEGKLVRELMNGRQSAGTHKINFDGSALSSGIYFYRLTSGSNSLVNKMILIK
jgi:flagellar hook assembly protein FlgD